MASNKKIATAYPLLGLRLCLPLILMGLLSISATLTPSASAKPLKTGRLSAKVLFTPPLTDKKPIKTLGAGSRGGKCMQISSVEAPSDRSVNASNASAQPPLMALMPVANTGLTLSEHPSFWVYVPKTPAKRAVLSLRENGSKLHSQTVFDISEMPGIMSLSLPQSAPALEVGKTYQWAVTLICGEKPNPNDPVIVSWVRRIASAPSAQSTTPTPLEQAAVYARHGIWFDALTALAQARRAQPNQPELQTTWADFLASAGLQSIATEPLRPEANP
jgi:Domain of Unknown Function (DUF928)